MARKVLTVGNMYPPQQLGGAELVWREWVEHARAAGDELCVLTTDLRLPGTPADHSPWVRRQLRWYWREHAFPRLGVRERLALERHNARVFDGLLDTFTPDVVVWWQMAGMSFGLIERARRRRLPMVSVLCDYWLTYGPDVDGWMRMFRDRPAVVGRVAERLSGLPTSVMLRRDMHYLFISETVRGRALEAYPDLPDHMVCHLRPDVDLFRPAPRPPWRFELLYAGRIDERKGVATAIRALTHLPPAARLTVDGAGDAGHLAELHRLAAAEGVSDRVQFTGKRPRASLQKTYAAADALLFPVTWAEPFGLVPTEAMAVGLPVIASGRGGSGEYLKDGENCLLFDADAGAAALAARVLELAGDRALVERLRAGGLATVERLSATDFNAHVQAVVTAAVS